MPTKRPGVITGVPSSSYKNDDMSQNLDAEMAAIEAEARGRLSRTRRSDVAALQPASLTLALPCPSLLLLQVGELELMMMEQEQAGSDDGEQSSDAPAEQAAVEEEVAEQAEGAACNEAGAEEEPIAESAEAEGEEPACAGSPHVLLEAAAPEAGAAEEPGAEEPAAADASSPPPEAEPAGKGPAASGAASGVKKPAVGLKRKGFAAPRAAATSGEPKTAATVPAKSGAAPAKVAAVPTKKAKPADEAQEKENVDKQPETKQAEPKAAAAKPKVAAAAKTKATPKPKPTAAAAAGKAGVAEEGGEAAPKVKRPLNAYMQYVNANRGQVKADHPELGNKELTSKLGELYRGLGAEEKKKYEDAAAADKQRYVEEVEAAGPQPKKAKGPKLPHTKSAYQLFTAERMPAIKAENPKAGMPEISKLMSAAWKECSEEDKAPFVQKAKELKAEAKAAAAAGGSADGEEAAEAKKKKRAAGGGEGPIRKRAKAGTGGKKAAAAAAEDAEQDEEGEEVAPASSHEEEAGGEESDDEEERMACDWGSHPAEYILSETSTGKYLVMRQGLGFTEYGLVDAAAAKAQRLGAAPGAPACPVPLAMVEEYEAFKKDFRREIHDNLDGGELVLDDLPRGSVLESCLLLGQLRRPTYELNRVPKNDTKMAVPMLRMCAVVQRMLMVERGRSQQKEQQLLEKVRGLEEELAAVQGQGASGSSGGLSKMAAELSPSTAKAVGAEA
ncbi:hypothetical protein CHLNCDRAFT_142731 [Chlorella variabilis]|uniref:HMG box domain-containing protein n=1 Tax=Chlorella variabilis TaxID=554065 RepID=E1Z8L4_CHLVA|nr:hypothetical protein CHLNCDRAFT_142731 [Chlorella variabilis]EFN57358.1 hypothetical protein CHLNCDRAFT_142731 [Chlorella variabilis]|eukprot:XP_005849460.1 hypothetical protein CHLNCDRAFT_142731 [Chlorella variabilis]